MSKKPFSTLSNSKYSKSENPWLRCLQITLSSKLCEQKGSKQDLFIKNLKCSFWRITLAIQWLGPITFTAWSQGHSLVRELKVLQAAPVQPNNNNSKIKYLFLVSSISQSVFNFYKLCSVKTVLFKVFPGGLVVKNLPPNAGSTRSIPGQRTKIPQAMGQLSSRATTRTREPGDCPALALELCSATRASLRLQRKPSAARNPQSCVVQSTLFTWTVVTLHYIYCCLVAKLCPTLFATPWNGAHPAP